MQQESLSLLAFQKMFRTEKACQKHLFELRYFVTASIDASGNLNCLTA
jgi:hypothetical protein